MFSQLSNKIQAGLKPKTKQLYNQKTVKYYLDEQIKFEIKVKQMKNKYNDDLREAKQELAERGISIRRINAGLKFITANTEEGKGTFSGEKFYEIIMASMAQDATKNLYKEEKQFIIAIAERIIKINEEVKKYKDNNSKKLEELKQQMIEAGIPLYIIKAKFAEFKANLKMLEKEANYDIELFRSEDFQEMMMAYNVPFIECFEEIAAKKTAQMRGEIPEDDFSEEYHLFDKVLAETQIKIDKAREEIDKRIYRP